MSQDTKLDLLTYEIVSNQRRFTSMTKVLIEYDYSGIDRVAGIPTTGQLITFQKKWQRYRPATNAISRKQKITDGHG